MRAVFRVLALLALLAYCPQVLAGPPRNLDRAPKLGESGRVVEAPNDLSKAPESLDIAGGLVWLVGPDGTASRHATRVPAGLYITWAGKANLEASIAREQDGYKSRIAELEAALRQRECPPAEAEDCPPLPALEAPRSSGGLKVWHVLVGAAVLFGGGYALGRYHQRKQ